MALAAGLAALTPAALFTDLATPRPALAHALETNLDVLKNNRDSLTSANTLLLHASFGDGQPAGAAVVRLVPPGGQPITVGRTGSNGDLSFALPSKANGDWEIQVDGGPGHRDYLTLPVRHGTADLQRLSQTNQPSIKDWLVALGWPAQSLVLGLVGGAAALWVRRWRRPVS